MKMEQMMYTEYDCIVVGAGPAASAFCTKAPGSLRILRLDGSFRGEKPCGGLLAPQAAQALAAMGLTLPKEVLADPQIFTVRTMDLHTGLERSYPRSYLNMDRAAFDGWLRSLAGKQVTSLQARALRIERQEPLWEVEYVTAAGERGMARAKYLIGADGAGGLVRRTVFPGKKVPSYLAIQQWYACVDQPLYACVFHKPTSPSCSWLFCKDGRMAFGGAFTHQGGAAAFAEQERILREQYGFGLEHPLKREACVVYRPKKRSHLFMGEGNCFLAGEAAGLISPSSFEGISFALRSGAALAETILQQDAQRKYRRATAALRREVLSRRLKRPFMYWQWLRSLILKSGLQAVAAPIQKVRKK